MTEPTPEFIYKIVTPAVLEAAEPGGILAGMPVDAADGYIHFSTAGQLAETLARHFAGQRDLWVLAVPTAAVARDLKWEPSRGGALFPHLYATLPLGQVTWRGRVSVAPDGTVDLPEAVR